MMEKLLSDQGVNFESNLLKQLCILIGTDKLHTSTYHAAGNGITERVNKVIKPNIAKYVNDDHDNWDLFLQMAISAYNNSYHSTIKMTPYEAQFGRKPVIVAEVIMNNQLPANTKIKDVSQLTVALRKSAEFITEIIRENTINAQAKQKFYYDRFVKDRAQFHIGDMVKINNYRSRIAHSKAFEPKFLGPYKITKILGELNYQLESTILPPQIVHYNRMTHFHVRSEFISEPKEVFTTTPQLPNNPKPSIKAYITSSIAPVDITIMQNPNLKRLKKKANKVLLTEFQRLGGIDCSSNPIVNTCQAIVPFRPAVQQSKISRSSNHQLEELSSEESSIELNNSLDQIDDQAASSKNEEGPRNAKGKLIKKCQHCEGFYEKKTGLRIHQMYCK